MWNQEEPRRDWGPIGSKVVKEDSTPKGLIYEWLSDSILPGGRLVNNPGIGVPTMKKATPKMVLDEYSGFDKLMKPKEALVFPAGLSSIGTSEDFNDEQPRLNWGPIGSKLVKTSNSGYDYTGMVYEWMSDSILPWGQLTNNWEIGIPSMKKATPKMLWDKHTGLDKLMDQGFHWRGEDVWNEWVPMRKPKDPLVFPASPSPIIGTAEDLNGVYKQSDVAPVNIRLSTGSSECESDRDITPDPGSPGGSSTHSESSTVSDVKDFKERFGYMGDVLPCFQKKQKKGKYFKSFSS